MWLTKMYREGQVSNGQLSLAGYFPTFGQFPDISKFFRQVVSQQKTMQHGNKSSNLIMVAKFLFN